ncbi:MAG: hypothetical protein GTO42_08885 [Candidatus Latescibacteria bacterium]|nr:hypothetical protein [Candidatus Latescibacterota bacterium]NIO29076.1 hypothetical protein [Candidatus Latescibacterota bacterium]NIO56701.1 hypothetical protein [Candidatus Latescibacterota bacterium]NIT02284.1 hypothetical protein [Candidatus Latescibacterota bacterium]NIT39169.1 hypothetical protein [Candidatus Latescibacterota bacterium]
MKRYSALIGVGLLFLTAVLISPLHAQPSKTRCLNIRAPQEGPAERLYFYSASGDVERLLDLRKHLISQGARKVNCFVPFIVVCEMPDALPYETLLLNSDITAMRENEINMDNPTGFIYGPKWVKQCYQLVDRAKIENPSIVFETARHDGFSFAPSEVFRRTTKSMPISSTEAEVRNFKQNSDVMLGDILAQFIYPESLGPQENWTDQALSAASGAAAMTLIFFQESHPSYPIDFLIRNITRSPTSTEPIGFVREDKAIWITDVMNNMGYMGDQSEFLQLVHQFNEEWRQRWHTDWAFTAFVVNSANDFDHRFGPGLTRYYAFGEHGGPCLAIPYPAGNPGTWTFRQVLKHEIGLVFWGMYEEPTQTTSCDDYSGYLRYRNWNKTVKYGPIPGSKEGCSTSIIPAFCIMNIDDVVEWWYDGPPCRHTDGMFGLADDNDNGVPDAVDEAPVVEFETAALESILTDEFELRFQAISYGVPNRNPYQNPAIRINYAVPVKDVSYKVNGVGPIRLLPADGESDETTEEFVGQLAELIPGLTEIEVVSRNTMGAISDPFLKRLYYLGLLYAHFRFGFDKDGIGISWNMLGDTFGAIFDLHRIGTDPEPYDSLIIADVQPSSTSNGYFTPYACVDQSVVPGAKYRYYVEGTFSVMYHGEEITITKRSKEFEIIATLPISKGSFISAPAPNPFRDETWISIIVPPTFRELGAQSPTPNGIPGGKQKTPAFQQEVPTVVNVTIYDAFGRKVKNLHSGSVLSTVLTIRWTGTNNNNQRVPSGVYFIKARAGDWTQAEKVLLLR